MDAGETEPGVAPESSWQMPKLLDPYKAPTVLASTSRECDAGPETNIFRSCNLCADGSVTMVACENRKIELYRLPLQNRENVALSPDNCFAQSENILGTLWYPTATPADPASFCFLASIRECPVKLLDASDGHLRASYKIVDHRERFVAPHSMAFNPLSSKLYCGFQDAIEVFDVHYPGEGDRILTTPTKKSKSGLKGIVSSLAFCPDYSGLYAAGTFSSSIALFSESSNAEIIQFLGGIDGPVTQVKFNPMQPHILYAASRQSNHILGWDLRGDTSVPLQRFERSGLTNQRLFFDIDAYGKTLVTGDKDGFISCFSVDGEIPEKPTIKFKAHHDAVAATVVHPLEPMAVSISGSRHFSASPSDSSDSSESEVSEKGTSVRSRPQHLFPFSKDTSLKLWEFPAREDIQSGVEFPLCTDLG